MTNRYQGLNTIYAKKMLCETKIYFYSNIWFINICNNLLNPKLHILLHDYNMSLILLLLLAIGKQNVNLYTSIDVALVYTYLFSFDISQHDTLT